MILFKQFKAAAIMLPVATFIVLPAQGQSLTNVTKEMLKALKLDSSILKGLDAELKVPPAWIAGAKKEGKVRVRLTMHPSRYERTRKVFEARYPFIKVEYSRGIGQARALGPLLAFKRGTFVSDIVSSFEALAGEYRKADALVNLRQLVTAKNPREEFNAFDGIWLAYRIQHYCMAYGKKFVKVSELPKTWDELLTNKRWHNGKTGIAINVNTWLAPLWVKKGEAWGRNYMDKLFNVVKPQIRKERLSATPKLVALGEFDLTIPGGDFIVKGHDRQGVPVGYHCPVPVPVTAASIGILKGNPHPNASLVYVNWTLSREGQLADHWGDNFIPSHKGLQQKRFLPYPKAVEGKPIAPLTHVVLKEMPKIIKVWHEYWIKGGGRVRGKKGGKKKQPR